MTRLTATLSRRSLFASSLALAALPALGLAARASTQGTATDTDGYPRLSIAVSDTAFAFTPEIPAGRYLVDVENPRAEGITVSFVKPPDGIGGAEAQADLGGGVPDWLFDAVFAGGPYARAGETAQAILDLTPGEWLLWGGQSVPYGPAILTVGPGPDADAVDPEVTATVLLQEFDFLGLDAGIPAGPQTWAFTNIGAQPHLMDLLRASGPFTVPQIMDFLMLEDGATPAAGVPSDADFEGVAGIAAVSSGQTSWLVLPDLAPGDYVALCFVPDAETGAPHAMMGMIRPFTIGPTATPVA